MNLSAYTKEFSANFRLAYPVILGMLGHTLIGLVDNIMVGRLGTTELAAVSLGNSFVFIAMSAGIGFSTALTPIVAQGDAAKDTAGIRAALHHGLLLCTLIGLFLFTIVYFATPLMDAMGQPREVIEMARPFIGWVGFSILPAMIFQGYKQFADGMSQTKYDMYAVIFSNVIHIGLNYLLIYGVWGLPKLGIMGAALGTVISRIALVLYMHFALTNDKILKPYFKGFSLGEFKMAMFKKIAGLGVLSSMQMLFEVALFTSAVWLSGFLGKTSQAANQIALSLASLTFMFAMGLSVTAMIRIGNQKGLKDYVNLRRIARSIILMAIVVEAVFALLFVALHNVLPYLFINAENVAHVADTGEVIAIASKLLIIAAVFQLSDGLQVVVLGTLRGLQDVKIPTLITFIAYWVVGFPLCYFLGVHTGLGAIGIWIGLLAGLTAAALFLYLRFNYLTNKLIHKDGEL
ncbi:multidrug transporter [Flavobacterium akiainvivens]|uniref:Multidrug-efflux transporter n=1 Tax=Flavobacterium akiainvivens TaxID=1202724 RepID=A0A0M8MAU5_9FLAO|nr:MATE family efflux transporter [Flavobacterium akiainvivens]KOS06215.1 multidrug transporter [Flavobacterium akiainvivens]SFQ68616.1 multidrug resistance protein, MATE family [Flavobacterium akiainvivens]